MRIPRLLAFYRAYPEFDGYSDEQCRKLLLQARLRRGDAAWVLPLLASIVLVGFWSIVALGVIRALATLLGITVGGGNLWAALLLFVVPAFIVSFVWLRRTMLVRSVRRLVNRAACPYCEFSLVGLPVRTNAVRCPECGQVVILSQNGLSPEDVRIDAPDPYRAMRSANARARAGGGV